MSLKEYYTERQVYSKVSRGRMKAIMYLAGDLSEKTVLDVGCGSGELGRLLKERTDVSVYGADVSPEAVHIAREVLDGAETWDIEGGGDFPESIRTRHFDLVIISEVLEHLFRPEQLLHALRKVGDAPVVITVPNVLFWKNRLHILLGHFEYEESGLMDRGHIHFFSWKSFRETIVETGYVIVEESHVIPTRGTSWLGRRIPGLFARQFAVRIEPMAY